MSKIALWKYVSVHDWIVEKAIIAGNALWSSLSSHSHYGGEFEKLNDIQSCFSGSNWIQLIRRIKMSYKNKIQNREDVSEFNLQISVMVQYKLLFTISNNTEVHEEPLPQTQKIPHCAIIFEASEGNTIVWKFVVCHQTVLVIYRICRILYLVNKIYKRLYSTNSVSSVDSLEFN